MQATLIDVLITSLHKQRGNKWIKIMLANDTDIIMQGETELW